MVRSGRRALDERQSDRPDPGHPLEPDRAWVKGWAVASMVTPLFAGGTKDPGPNDGGPCPTGERARRGSPLTSPGPPKWVGSWSSGTQRPWMPEMVERRTHPCLGDPPQPAWSCEPQPDLVHQHVRSSIDGTGRALQSAVRTAVLSGSTLRASVIVTRQPCPSFRDRWLACPTAQRCHRPDRWGSEASAAAPLGRSSGRRLDCDGER